MHSNSEIATYITLFVIDDGRHVHVADIGVICKVVGQGSIVSGKE